MQPAVPTPLLSTPHSSASSFQRVSHLLRNAQNGTPDIQKIFIRAVEEAKKLPNTPAGMLLRTVCYLKSWNHINFSEDKVLELFIVIKHEMKILGKELSNQTASHPFLPLFGSIYFCLYSISKDNSYIQKARDILVRVAQNQAQGRQYRDESPQAKAQFDAYLNAGLACLIWFREKLDYSEEIPQVGIVKEAIDWLEKAFAIYPKSDSLIYLLGLSCTFLDHLAQIISPQQPLLRAIEVLHQKEDYTKPLPLQHLFLLGVCQYRAAFDNNPISSSDTLTRGIHAYDTFFRAFKGKSTDKTFTGDVRALIFATDSARLLYWMTRLEFYRKKAAFFIQLMKKFPAPLPFLPQVVIKIYEIQTCLIDKTLDKLSEVIDQLRELINTVNGNEDPPISETLVINLQDAIKLIMLKYQELSRVVGAEYDLLACRIGNKISTLEIYNLTNNAIYNELNKLNLLPELDESLVVENELLKEGT